MLYMFLLYKDPDLPVPPDVMEQHGAVETKSKARKAYARQIPDAQFGAVEVRPIGYPEDSWLNR